MERRDPTAGNERLTAATAVVLLLLLAAEGVTILSIRSLLSPHIVIGLLLIPPVALKLASTGYRFARYYSGDPAYVAKGPPHMLMRLLAPLLALSTLTVLGTGVGLLVLGPSATATSCSARPRARRMRPDGCRNGRAGSRSTTRTDAGRQRPASQKREESLPITAQNGGS